MLQSQFRVSERMACGWADQSQFSQGYLQILRSEEGALTQAASCLGWAVWSLRLPARRWLQEDGRHGPE